MRVVNRLAALLLGLVLLAGGLLALVEGVLAAAGRRPWPVDFARWYGPLTRTPLSSSVVLGVSIGIGVLGILVLLLELRPWAPVRLGIRRADDPRPLTWWVLRRSVERQVSAACDGVPGLSETHTRLRGRDQRWRLVVRPRGRNDARPDVDRTVAAVLDRVAAPGAVRVRVALRRPKRVA
ncbi:hypothetical protein [Actinocatenispora rupis]|uniref:Alkaline shock response membrane anchor protein AmaP n=1 Tax=Actinocatenispora rupis TaxID=519421 RepID=A0A8J3J581_9ACTN|nr:hypothetical protein [Actinocatenispora rupis]GID12197.1 hypothetical protein Aru02nite_30860 [Actinocatenispora rupis]